MYLSKKIADPAIHRRQNYVIASGLVWIIDAILSDQKAVLTVSNAVGRAQGMPELEGDWLSLPCIVGSGGLYQTIAVDLSPSERANLFLVERDFAVCKARNFSALAACRVALKRGLVS